jgi:hypothetical protein
MAAAAPLPKKPEVNVDEELDAAIDRIDQCLPVIHAKVEQAQRSGDTPSSAFHPKRIMQTQRVFQSMAEDPLLTESGLDIKINGMTNNATNGLEPED